MTKAKVYFSDMRTRYGGLSLPQKLGKLIEAAGIGDIDFQNNPETHRFTRAAMRRQPQQARRRTAAVSATSCTPS